MDSQKIQEIIISTIEEIAKNTVLNTNFLTLINGQISYVDKFNNYYNFTYQKEEYTGFSITGEKYEIGDLVYVLKLNNDLTSKQMIISKVNSYTNFDIELAINNSLEEIKNSINQIETQDKEISIIGNTVFTLNDDLTITPEELTFSAQRSSNINDIIWYVDGEQQVQDELKKLTISNSMVKNKDSLIIRVEDFNNSEVYDEITVIRAMSSDTKLELDLGLDSILLQKNEQGIIDYSKAILTPKVLSEGNDVTSEGWSFNYKIENGAITLVKEQNNYKITNMDSDKGKISFFAIKNGNMYLQKVIYLSVVTYGDYNLNIIVSNQNFLISKTNDDKIKENTLSTTIRALKGDKILKIVPDLNVPQIGNVPGKMVVNDDYSVTYSWDLSEETVIDSVNGEIKLLYTIENEQHNSIILWTTVNDGASGAVYRLDINPPNIIKNGDGTFSPSEIIIKSLFNEKGNEVLCDGYFKIYKTIDNKIYTLDYESEIKENTKNYTITDLDLKSLKIEFLDINKKLLITEYCYVNVNSSDFIEVTTKTENNETHLTAIDGQIQGLVKKDETIETTITNLQTNTEEKFTEINEQYSEINQQIDNVTITVSDHTEQLESINGEIVSQGERLSKAEQKITDEAIVNTVTKSESWQQISDDANEALENSKSIKLNATSTAFSKAKGASAYIPSNITITAELKSQTFEKYEYATGTNGTFAAVVNGQHGFTLSGSTLTISNSSDLFTNSNNAIIIKGSTSTNSASDKITVIRVSDGVDGTAGKPGADAYTAILGNESISISCLNNGNTAAAATFTIPVYAYLGSTMFASTISMGTLPSGITAQVTNGTSSATGKIVLTIANNSNLGGAKNGTIQVNVNINGKVFAKQISWSKSIAGTNGTDGSPGASGRVYFLEPTTVIIKKGKDNKLNPSNVTFSSFYRDGTSATRTSYLGRFIIQESTDGSSYTTKYISSTNEGSKTYTPTNTAKSIRCTMYAAGGTTTSLDTQTVAIIEDIDGIEIGGKNLLLNSGIEYSNTNYPTHIYNMSELMKQGDIYTIKIWGKLGSGKSKFGALLDGGSIGLGSLINNNDGTYSLTFTGKAGTRTDYSTIHIYPMPSSVSSTSTITKIKLEKGNVATDWTPAPEDIEEDLSAVEKRVTSAEQKLTSTQWSLWFTEVVNNSVATSTKFTMDKNGLHIKGGGIDISNNAGTKVFYADTNGNLVINNLTANNGIFNGEINATSGIIGGWTIRSKYLECIAYNEGFNITYTTSINADTGTIRFLSDASLYETNMSLNGIEMRAARQDSPDRWVYSEIYYGIDGIRKYDTGNGENLTVNVDGVTFGGGVNTVGIRHDHGGGLELIGYVLNDTQDSQFLLRGEWWNNSDTSKHANNVFNGINFAYTKHGTPTTGNLVTFSNNRDNYQWQIIANYQNPSNTYIRCKNGDNNTWSGWKKIQMSGDALTSGTGNQHTFIVDNWIGFYRASDGARVGWMGANSTNNLEISCEKGWVILRNTNDSVRLENTTNLTYSAYFTPESNGRLTLGTASHRWFRLYQKQGSIDTSDEREKHNIIPIKDVSAPMTMTRSSTSNNDNIYEQIFNLLVPKIYCMNNVRSEIENNKIHIGFVAQDLANTLESIGISEDEMGLIDHSSWIDEETGEEKDSYGLCYTEFIALNTHMIQKCLSKISKLENTIKDLKGGTI